MSLWRLLAELWETGKPLLAVVALAMLVGYLAALVGWPWDGLK